VHVGCELSRTADRDQAGEEQVHATAGRGARVVVYTTFVGEGTLFYYLTLAPEKDAQALQDTFTRVGESIRLTEPR